MSLLRSSPYVTIELDEQARVVRFVRSSRPFGNVSEAREELSTWQPALVGLDPRSLGVLVDFRRTPMTSDPEILRALVDVIDALALGFARRAILIMEPILGARSERLSAAGAKIPPFLDEASAWAHLVGDVED